MRKQRIFAALIGLITTLSGCAEDSDAPVSSLPGPMPAGAPSSATGACGAVTQAFDVTTAQHVMECSALPTVPNPPAGGDHYGIWAAFQTYDFPIAHGYLIHSMEHGAVVLYYNCPDGCADEVAAAEAFLDAQPEDATCYGTPSKRRAVLVPDPTLDVPWAASAWGFTLRAHCFDPEAFGAFFSEHYAHGLEDFCNPGLAFTASPCQAPAP